MPRTDYRAISITRTRIGCQKSAVVRFASLVAAHCLDVQRPETRLVAEEPVETQRHPGSPSLSMVCGFQFLGLQGFEWVILRDHSGGSMQVRTLRRRYSSSRSP